MVCLQQLGYSLITSDFNEIQLLLTDDPDRHESETSVDSLEVFDEEIDRSFSLSLSVL